MPTYEYACSQCGHEFEAFQSMKDEPLEICPECQRRSVKRKVGGGAGLIFKGSGFYITDYKKPAGGGEAKPAGSGESGGAAGKAESKPAKTESKPASPASS